MAKKAVEPWERWISEIVDDFWSVARVGIGSTLSLIEPAANPGMVEALAPWN